MKEIIEIKKTDLLDVVKLEKLCFPNDAYSQAFIEEMMDDEKVIFVGYEDESKLVAMAFLYNWQGEKDFIKLINMGVHPDYRNRGYAHRLVEWSIDLMKRQDLYKVKAETRASNKPMQRVFEKYGFDKVSENENYYSDPVENAYRYIFSV